MSASRTTLGDLAVRFGCELHGDPSTSVERVASLSNAGPSDISFVVNPRWRDELIATRAGAIVLDDKLLPDCRVPALVTRNPHAVFARIAQQLHPLAPAEPGRHPSAVVEAGAEIDPSAEIQALSFVGRGARIGARAVVGQGAVVGAGAVLGEDTRILPRAVVCHGVRIGPRCIIHPGAVLGGDGFGHANERGVWVRVPQIGGLVLGADVEIGCNTTVDRGALGDTVIDEGVKIDNLVQIGHNCRIGAHTAIAGKAGLAGSSVVGKRCQLAGDAGITGHVTLCDDVIVAARATITADVDQPGLYSGLIPAEPAREWRRLVAEFRNLGKLRERLRALEKKT